MQKVRKGLKVEHNEPIDNFIVKYFCNPISPLFRITGHSANMISIYGLALSLVSLYYLFNDDILRFTFYFWVCYGLDCLDGYYARRYNMVTAWGDMFEHVRDITYIILTIGMTIFKYTLTDYAMYVLVLSSVLTGIHVGCVQKSYNNNGFDRVPETLDYLEFLCYDPAFIHLSGHFGVGMYMVTLNILILYLSKGMYYFVKCCGLILFLIYGIGYVRLNHETRGEVQYEDEYSEPGDEVITVPKEIFPDYVTLSEKSVSEIS